ncbi:helix-turn-helix domain-containing protein [Paracoccus aminophilus]|uniref:Transcriptional regulator, XRE family n=1 Tax=Paracoccus aminophilus JCM 7686 TaxID=1367847 RepID=S5XR32_PARAH|nr:XRE family transcriptional regulator [Paracoccus aminophilus]AGT09864.1 transcriptional regulator, XRE family [Paracoccus aminophilus JCM 7686]
MDNETVDADFGIAVRSRRAELGITLEQLAANSGVSVAALSRLERGLLGPSLRNALAIARALGCDLTNLIESPAAQVTRAGDNLRYFDAATGIERLALARPAPHLELLLYTVPAGQSSVRFAAHRPGTREVFHLLSGELELHHGPDPLVLKAGDSATVRADHEHWFTARGSETARFILLVLGRDRAE